MTLSFDSISPRDSCIVCILAAGGLTLGGATSAPGIASHWNSLGVALDVLEVLDGALELPAIDGLGGLAGILEGDTEVRAPGAGGFAVLDLGSCVANLVGGDMLVIFVRR